METISRQRQWRRFSTRELVCGCAVSLIVVLISQFALLLVPLFVLQSSSLFSLLLLTAVILLVVAGFAKGCKRLFNVRASPPAMVLFHMLFIWGIYFAVVRRALFTAISPLEDFAFNGGIPLLIFGLSRILSSNPGYIQGSCSSLDYKVINDSISVDASEEDDFSAAMSLEENSFSIRRVRYCRICEAWVTGFDHHCPAFGNCIGKKNHLLFMILLVGFIVMETLYSRCSFKYLRISGGLKVFELQSIFYDNLAASTMLFCVLQVLWQILFFAWHVYCVCFNITTDEWTNWKKYQEFHFTEHPSGESIYTNPYDSGLLCNLKEFILAQDDC